MYDWVLNTPLMTTSLAALSSKELKFHFHIPLIFINIPLVFKKTWQETNTSECTNSKINIYWVFNLLEESFRQLGKHSHFIVLLYIFGALFVVLFVAFWGTYLQIVDWKLEGSGASSNRERFLSLKFFHYVNNIEHDIKKYLAWR